MIMSWPKIIVPIAISAVACHVFRLHTIAGRWAELSRHTQRAPLQHCLMAETRSLSIRVGTPSISIMH